MSTFKNVGQSLRRKDGRDKLMGKAQYPQDMFIDGMVYGHTVRSTKPHANITFDISEAEAVEGVLKVLTYKDVYAHNHHGVLFKDHQVFAVDRVRRIGDPIAFVVAETSKIAEQAAALVKVEYEALPAVFDPREAMLPDAPVLHGDSNIIYHYKCRKGNVEEAFSKCDVIIEKEYETSMVDHVFLQLESGLAYVEEGKVFVIASSQYPHFDRIEVSDAIGKPEDDVVIINPSVGGAFGGREDITMQIHLALAAMHTGKPVKVTYQREESFYAHSKRHPLFMKFKTGATKEGKLLAMEVEIVGDTGAYASWAINVMRKAGVHCTGPYECDNVKVDSIAVYTNNPYAGAMRGFGATQTPVGTEQQMDMLAEACGIHPIDIRLINGFKKNSMTANDQKLVDSVPLEECIRAVEQRLYPERSGKHA